VWDQRPRPGGGGLIQNRAGGDPHLGSGVSEQAGADLRLTHGRQAHHLDLLEAAVPGERLPELQVGDVLAERIVRQFHPPGRVEDRQAAAGREAFGGCRAHCALL